MLLDPHGRDDAVRAIVQRAAFDLAMTATVSAGRGDNRQRPTDRAVVVLLGHPLPAKAVAAVSASIAARGANIDRIRRLSRYPVTTVEFDVSGADLTSLRHDLALVAVQERVDVAVSPPGWLDVDGGSSSSTSTPP